MENVDTNQNIDIILTPQFYTFIKEELGVKFTYQAKQIAPSLFDDYLDTKQTYQYHVYKCDDKWCFFAYSIDEVTLFLEEKGLKIEQIGKIFFAQDMDSYLEKAIDLGHDSVLQSLDGTVTLLPKRLMSSDYIYNEIDLNKISLQNGIAISSSYDSFIPLKQTILITSLLAILGGIFIVEGNRVKSSIANEKEKLDILVSKNSRLSSNRVRKSILGTYEPIDKRERLKRDTIEEVSKLMTKNISLKNITVDDSKIVVTLKAKNASAIKPLIKKAKAKMFKVKKEANNQIKMEKSI